MQTPNEQARQLAQMIDHTLLKADATYEQVETLCREAVECGFKSICVHPIHVSRCVTALHGSPVRVCTVAGFPLGTNTSGAKAFEAQEAVDLGAIEIDMVMNVGALKSNDWQAVERDIAGVATVCHAAGGVCKVIIETCLLSNAEKVTACQVSQAAGADFVKTSTGFSTDGATPEDVRLMRATVGSAMGVKAAGGIRSYKTAAAMVDAGANRIGTSASVNIIKELLAQ